MVCPLIGWLVSNSDYIIRLRLMLCLLVDQNTETTRLSLVQKQVE